MNRWLLAVACLMNAASVAMAQSPPASGRAQDSTKRNPHAVQPERPTVATHAGTVAPGWVELEEGGEWDRFADGSRSFAAPANLKIGLAGRGQLNLLASVIHTTPVSRATALGDLTVGVKYRALEHAPLLGDFAFLSSVKFPTASAREGFGTGTTDLSLLLISSHELGSVDMDLNAGLTKRSGDGSRVPKTATVWTASFGFLLTGAFGWVAEVFGYPGTAGPQGQKGSVALLAGPTFSAREWLALDLGTITPVTGPQPRAAYAGFVWNIGSLSSRNAESKH